MMRREPPRLDVARPQVGRACVVDHLQLLSGVPIDTGVVLGILVIVDDDRVRLSVGVADECCAIQVAKGDAPRAKRRSCEQASESQSASMRR